MDKENTYYATGRRKTAVARTWISPGNGDFTINGKPAEDYFSKRNAIAIMSKPFAITNNAGSYDVRVTLKGGGPTGQVEAVRHGITRALIEAEPDTRVTLKRAGFVKRDPRAKERKKYGQRGARARFQFSKR
jgi:small subunit ribosomal protein S9